MSGAETPIIGIDLGTTNSVVAVFRAGSVEVLPNELGESLTPSVVALDPRDSGVVVGRTARELVTRRPECGATSFKRDMGTDRTHGLGEERLTATELSAFVLKALRTAAERALGCEVERAVITVPAYFGEAQRRATLRAAELAGLKVERVLNEPTAAAMAYGLHRRAREGCFLVFDLGGGTFDVSVMELFEGVLEVRSTAGESRLGGDDFTAALVGAALERLGLDFELVEWKDPEGFAQLTKRCELAKRKLVDDAAFEIEAPALKGFLDAPRPVRLDADAVAAVFAPLLERLRGPCRQALRGAGLTADDLDEVILVGGATRLAAVRRVARELFGRDALDSVDPDLIVAHGAALQAALQADDAAVEDVVVTDVLSHSLGVAVAHEIAGRHVDGYFSPVIHRNTTIPTSRSNVYAPIRADQTVLELEVFEGESRRVQDNRLLGTLSVSGIPRGDDEGRRVEVRFTYDLNGILEVEATILATGRVFSRVFERSGTTMTEAERGEALTRLARLKADPRDEAVNAELIARAEALMVEVDEVGREALELALLEFERAIEARTPDLIRQARRQLRGLCEGIDGNDRW
ncbi:MAG: Hsp70 family protein [Planctomycetota bacterium]